MENGTLQFEDRIVYVSKTELHNAIGGAAKVYVTAESGSFGKCEEVGIRFFADPTEGYKIGDEIRVTLARVTPVKEWRS